MSSNVRLVVDEWPPPTEHPPQFRRINGCVEITNEKSCVLLGPTNPCWSIPKLQSSSGGQGRFGRRAICHVQLLIEAGSDVAAHNICDMTALMLAARYGHSDVVQMLLEAGSDVTARDQ